MGKKAALYDETERLYVQDGKTLEEISNTLQVSTTSLSEWKKDGEWADQRARYLKSERHFKDTLHELKKKVAEVALEDPNPQNVYSLCRIIAASKPYVADELKKIDEEEKKETDKGGLTPERVREIEEIVLGLTR